MSDAKGHKNMSKANGRQNTKSMKTADRRRARWKANRRKAWNKHMEAHPNDLRGKEVIERKIKQWYLN